MDRFRSLFQKGEADDQEYRPLYDEGVAPGPESTDEHDVPFSWVEYGIFGVLGIAIAMGLVCLRAPSPNVQSLHGLTDDWDRNMFLAAAPYFQHRFEADDWAPTKTSSPRFSPCRRSRISPGRPS